MVWKLDRIGRSLGHVVELVGGLQAKGIGLKVLTGGIDTTSSTGRLVFGIFATLAEFERDLIKERTLAGLAAARARGRTGGRPRLMTRAKLRKAMTMMADRNNVASEVAEQLGISVSTLYAYVDGARLASEQKPLSADTSSGKRPALTAVASSSGDKPSCSDADCVRRWATMIWRLPSTAAWPL